MKILRLLNKKTLIFCLTIITNVNVIADDKPVDIWNIDKEEISQSNEITKETSTENDDIIDGTKTDIYSLQTKKKNNEIQLEQTIESKKIKINGLYDPEDYGLSIDMWSNSDGDQLKVIFRNLEKLNLSDDAREIMNISILTNAHYPNRNISEKEFLSFKSKWLIKNADLDLIEEYLVKNQIFNLHPELSKHLVDQYLSQYKLKKACQILSKSTNPFSDEYLSRFQIYCLATEGKINEAQLILDLKKELGFQNNYFENKLNFLFGYDIKLDKKISEKSILDFHLAHATDTNFSFEPSNKTDKIIWKYLSSANLLYNIEEIEITEFEKISIIEKATHNKNYPEKDLYKLYKRFQFNINQLLNAKDFYKSLTNIEARALIYQKVLLESEKNEKLKLLKILKELFKKDNLANAFDEELKNFLNDIDPAEVPDNLTSFYYTNIEIEKNLEKKIKFNNNIIHQSKLLNYFNGDYSKSKIAKDLNNILKKVKKDKDYFLSKKDIIFLESLKSDGVEISKKYEDLYKINDSEIPSDIQVMINNNESGAALMRIVEVIGQDELTRIDEDTIYFIISTLNQLNIDQIRNKILLKVLPLKV